MTDIDFDELDRAVSSLMDQHNNPTPPQPAAPAQNSDQPVASSAPAVGDSVQPVAPAPEPVSAPQVAQPEPVVQPVPEPVVEQPDVATPTPAPVPATEAVSAPEAVTAAAAAAASAASPLVQRRASGRFMDVIPSANSRVAANRPSPSEVPSREAPTVQPLDNPAGNSVGQTEAVAYEEQPVAPTQATDDTDIPEIAPLESPFIEGIAVDKRPLGQSSQDGWQQPMAESVTPASSEPSQDSTHPAETDPWASEPVVEDIKSDDLLRPELGAEILAVESASIQTEEAPAAEPVVTDKKAKKKSAMPASPVAEPSVTTVPQSPGDITPQYTPAEANSPEPSGIFEAATDAPQQLKHPESKKFGWGVVIWILLLIIIGAGGGVAAWYFFLK